MTFKELQHVYRIRALDHEIKAMEATLRRYRLQFDALVKTFRNELVNTIEDNNGGATAFENFTSVITHINGLSMRLRETRCQRGQLHIHGG